jgi:hypothetical protein
MNFQYVQASTNLLTVNLFVLPYNYPMLLPLLDELFKQHRLKPTNDWRNQFHNYLRTMPAYYAGTVTQLKCSRQCCGSGSRILVFTHPGSKNSYKREG